MYKIKIINIIVFLTFFCSCNNFNNPTEGFKVEGNIENPQDCSHISGVEVYAYNLDNNEFAKISESKYENNYFSLFLPYELKNKYCNAINKCGLFDSKSESHLTISNKNVTISKISISSINEEWNNDIQQFGYTESYNNGAVSVTLVKTKYVYARSAVYIKGEYEAIVATGDVVPTKTVKVDLLLQKGWNIVYNIGCFASNISSSLFSVDMAILNVTTIKPENIELKWYYNSVKFVDILRNNTQFVLQPYMAGMGYDKDFILNSY